MDILLERMLSFIPKKPDGKYVHGEKKKFCLAIGAPVNIVSEWESGKTKSYRNYAYAVSQVYGVSIEWLRGETDKKEPAAQTGDGLDDLQKQAFDLIKKIPTEQLQTVIGVLKAILGES